MVLGDRAVDHILRERAIRFLMPPPRAVVVRTGTDHVRATITVEVMNVHVRAVVGAPVLGNERPGAGRIARLPEPAGTGQQVDAAVAVDVAEAHAVFIGANGSAVIECMPTDRSPARRLHPADHARRRDAHHHGRASIERVVIAGLSSNSSALMGKQCSGRPATRVLAPLHGRVGEAEQDKIA